MVMPADPVRQLFRISRDGVNVVCKFCGLSRSAKSTTAKRMRAHLEKVSGRGIAICSKEFTLEERAMLDIFLCEPQGRAAMEAEPWSGAGLGDAGEDAGGHEPADEMEVGEDTSAGAMGECLQGAETLDQMLGTLDWLPDMSEGGSILTDSTLEGPFALSADIPVSSVQPFHMHNSSVNNGNISNVYQHVHVPITSPSNSMQSESASAAQPSHQGASPEENVGNPPQDQGSSGLHYQEPTLPTHTTAENTSLPAVPEAGAFVGTLHAQSIAELKQSSKDKTKSALQRYRQEGGRRGVTCVEDQPFCGLLHAVASLFAAVIDCEIKRNFRDSVCDHTDYPVDLAQDRLFYSQDIAKIVLAWEADPVKETLRLHAADTAALRFWKRLPRRSEVDQAIGWPLCPTLLGVVEALREFLMSESGPNLLLPGNSFAGGDSAEQDYFTDGPPLFGDQPGDSNNAPQYHAPSGAYQFGKRVSAGGAQGGSFRQNEAICIGNRSLPSVSSSAGDAGKNGASEVGATREEGGMRCDFGAPLEEGVGDNLAAVAGPETSAADVSADEGETSETETEDEWDLLEDLADILRKPGIGAGTPSRLDPTKPKESMKPKGSDTSPVGDDSGDKVVRTIGSIRSSNMLVTKASQLTETERECWRKDLKGYGLTYRPPGSRTKYTTNCLFMDDQGNYYRSYNEACDEADRRRAPGANKVPRAGAYKQVS